jgi:hypothetical protein
MNASLLNCKNRDAKGGLPEAEVRKAGIADARRV